jgi:hypothetical protein
MRVTLDVFSGRPNPSWELSSWHVRELQARVGDKTLSPVRMTQPKLGFRGLSMKQTTLGSTDFGAHAPGAVPDGDECGGAMGASAGH